MLRGECSVKSGEWRVESEELKSGTRAGLQATIMLVALQFSLRVLKLSLLVVSIFAPLQVLALLVVLLRAFKMLV